MVQNLIENSYENFFPKATARNISVFCTVKWTIAVSEGIIWKLVRRRTPRMIWGILSNAFVMIISFVFKRKMALFSFAGPCNDLIGTLKNQSITNKFKFLLRIKRKSFGTLLYQNCYLGRTFQEQRRRIWRNTNIRSAVT